ncbi:MAG: YidB family protein [Reyranella sp.]|nr:YidB family protein [Reyranella sp.]
MGLFDVLNGMQNGPRGYRGGTTGGGGGMSPITMAVLGLLAYKAVKSFGGSQPATAGGTANGAAPQSGGNFGDWLKNGLGGLLGAGPAASLSGGLADLVKQFQQGGQGAVADSWVSKGDNRPIPPSDLKKVLTPEQVEVLARQAGMSREELLEALSEHLPKTIDALTPEGRLPTEQEIARLT